MGGWHLWFDAHDNVIPNTTEDESPEGFLATLQTSDVWFSKAELPCEFATQKVRATESTRRTICVFCGHDRSRTTCHVWFVQDLVRVIKQLMRDHPQLTSNCDVQINWRLFREGVMPLWEHPGEPVALCARRDERDWLTDPAVSLLSCFAQRTSTAANGRCPSRAVTSTVCTSSANCSVLFCPNP